jgi:outer membrane immunogenic protein
MKDAFRIAAIAALIGTPALAADIAVKAPPPPPAPIFSWTGFYVGGNVGYSWGDARTNIAGSATTFSTPGPSFGFVANPPVVFVDSAKQLLQGVIGGGQIGYNYQFSPQWVLGFETDIQGSGERGSNTFTDPISGTLCIAFDVNPLRCASPDLLNPQRFSGAAVTSYEAKIEWFGTVRGRLGVLMSDSLLLYGTGGLAYGHVSASGNVSMNANTGIPTIPVVSFGGTSPFGQSKTNIGFAAGVGLEGRLSNWLPPNWTLRMEYLYVDLGSLGISTPIAAASSASEFSALTGTLTTHTHFTDNIVRVGLNYQFH